MEKRDSRKVSRSKSEDGKPRRDRRQENQPRTKKTRTFRKEDDKPRERDKFNREDKPERKRSFNRDDKPREKRSFNRDDKPREKRSFNRNDKPREKRSFNRDDKPERKRSFNRDDKPERKRSFDREERPKRRDITAESEILSEIVELRRKTGRAPRERKKVLSLEYEEANGPIRLNKYIANSGICSRRDADILIETGAVTVNGKIVTELGTKIMPTDEVRYQDKILQREKPVYVLLNKPKDFITTMEDERGRKHVMNLVANACKERIYPVGRLDRNTTGLLLFTNDGEMAKKLTHPKHGIKKIYHVELNRAFSGADFEKLRDGIELEDGFIKPDEVEYVNVQSNKRELGITIHSGKNRVVRRVFETLGYEIEKLDRVYFAGLTKKDLPRGSWRILSQKEINMLKMSV